MTRWLTALALVVVCAGTARADGFVKLGVELATTPKPPPAKADVKADAKADARADATAPAEPEATGAQASAAEPEVKAELFPERAIARNPRPDLVYVPSTPIETPPRQGIALGDDRDWRVQAAQVGVMAGAFAALVALCGNGKCMW